MNARDQKLAAQILQYNIHLAKAMVEIYQEIDSNLNPNFKRIQHIFEEMVHWLEQIEALSQVLKVRVAETEPLLMHYLKDIASLRKWLKERLAHCKEVEQKLKQNRQAWVYSNRNCLNYEPNQWLDESAIRLASVLQVSLH